jgi:hypothetical protein
MRHAPRRRQRGAVAIIVGLSLAVLIGAVGLALDGGRLYVNKTETQNAADACALAASKELTGAPNIPLTRFPIAESAGRLVATRNNVNLQSHPVANGDITVEFSTALTGAPWVSAGSATGDAKYVRCTITETGIAPWFMQVLGFGDQTVQSLATATLAPSQGACTAIPIGICAPTPAAPDFGLVVGQWLDANFGTGGQLTGSFGWLDFSPPNGGASELAALLRGTGACTVETGQPVGQSGATASLRLAWNTRFGIYAPSEPSTGPGAAVPDWAGYSYYTTNWTHGISALSHFKSRRSANAPFGSSVADGNSITGLGVGPGGSTVKQSSALGTGGGDRRLVPAPIIDCSGFSSSQTVPVLGWGCILMLHPINQSGPMTVSIEYTGLASAGACSTIGWVGSSSSTGPLVPALVQ